MKKQLAIILAVLILATPVFAMKGGPVEIALNGQDITYEQENKPLIKEDRTFVPARLIAEKNGYEVGWNDKTRGVTLTKGDEMVEMVIGSKNYKANGEAKTMDVAPFIEGNHTYLPARFLGEVMGLSVVWDEVNRVATIGFYGEDRSLQEGEEVFVFEGTGMAINLPKDAKDQILIKKIDTGYEIYDKMHQDQKNEWTGLIGTVTVMDHPAFEVPGAILDYQDGNYALFIHVSDVNCDINNETLQNSYVKSDKMVWELLKTAHKVEEAK